MKTPAARPTSAWHAVAGAGAAAAASWSAAGVRVHHVPFAGAWHGAAVALPGAGAFSLPCDRLLPHGGFGDSAFDARA